MLAVTVHQSGLAFPGHLSLVAGMCHQTDGLLRKDYHKLGCVKKTRERLRRPKRLREGLLCFPLKLLC